MVRLLHVRRWLSDHAGFGIWSFDQVPACTVPALFA